MLGSDAGADAGADAGDDASTDVGPDAGTTGPHVLISEIATDPGPAEMVEIHNPTEAAIDLTEYYLSDNSAYYTLTAGPWTPDSTPGTDFLVQFPSGTTIDAGAYLVIAMSDMHETQYAACPDFYVTADGSPTTCDGNPVPSMTIPTNGSGGENLGSLLSNGREMVVLFRWNGTGATVQDVDYVTWGDLDDNSRIDKTGVDGYADDTARASQMIAPTAAANSSIERCDLDEPEESTTGGNGLTGHDETSEDLGASFVETDSPTPGAANGCL